MTTERIEKLLYEDDAGDVIGLDEVQLLDPPPLSRVPELRELLTNPNLHWQYLAAQVLTAWGDDEGLRKIEQFVDMQIHTQDLFEPHRLHGYDNVYDELAYAVYLYGGTGKAVDAPERVYRKLLALYGPCQFESKLKYALMHVEFPKLAVDIQVATERALSFHRTWLASQLLPPLARRSPQAAASVIAQFPVVTGESPNPSENVAEALGYIDSADSRQQLKSLSASNDSRVRAAASAALQRLASR